MYLHCAILLHDVHSDNKRLIAADLGTCYQLRTADARVQSQLSIWDSWWTNKYRVRIYSSQFFYSCLVAILPLLHTNPFSESGTLSRPVWGLTAKELGVTSLQIRIILSPHPISMLPSAVVITGVDLTVWIMSWHGTGWMSRVRIPTQVEIFVSSSECISLRLSPSALFNGYRWIAPTKSLSFCMSAFKASLNQLHWQGR
jgi:hypothetical protein